MFVLTDSLWFCLAGHALGSGSNLSAWDAGSNLPTPAASRPSSMDYGPRAPPPSLRGFALGSDLGSDMGSRPGSELGSVPPSGRPSFEIGSGAARACACAHCAFQAGLMISAPALLSTPP